MVAHPFATMLTGLGFMRARVLDAPEDVPEGWGAMPASFLASLATPA